MVIGRLLLSDADLGCITHVSTDIGKKLDSGVHLALKEAEKRVLDIVNRTLQCNQLLQKTFTKKPSFKKTTTHCIKVNMHKNSRGRPLQLTSLMFTFIGICHLSFKDSKADSLK